MKHWSEFNIALIYYAGLAISLLLGILVLLYLHPVKSTLKKMMNNFESLWSGSFKTTVLLAGVLGALSVSFRDCHGKYDYLLTSKRETVTKGLEQVSASCYGLVTILSLWLVIFLILRLNAIRNSKISPAK